MPCCSRFNSHAAIDWDLCQIVLVGRVTPGSSIQKELVKEAKLCAAMVVVLGANKKYSFG